MNTNKVMLIIITLMSIAFCKGISNIGVRISVNIASYSGDDVDTDNIDIKYDGSIGGFVQYQLNEKYALQSELNYSGKGLDIKKGAYHYGSTHYWLEIPVFGLINFEDKMTLYGGPYMGIFISGSNYMWGPGGSISRDIESKNISNPDYGLILGSSFLITKKLSVDTRYSMGLVTLDPDGEEVIKNKVIQIMFGYSLLSF